MTHAVRAIIPGSFDPITNGHIDIIRRSAGIFDQVLVAVLSNAEKNPLFSLEERLELVREQFVDYGDRVQVHRFEGLLVDFAKDHAVNVIVRGLRAISDYDYEAGMALMNRSLDSAIETVFLMAHEEHAYISSSMVRQVAGLGGTVGKLVPAEVERALMKKFGRTARVRLG